MNEGPEPDGMLIPEFIEPTPEVESTVLRRKVEEEILSLLLAEPGLRRAPLPIEDEAPTTVLDLLTHEQFQNLDLALLAEAMLAPERGDETLTVQALLSELTQERVRTVVPVLFRRGAALTEVTDPTAEARLLEACMAMRDIDGRSAYERDRAAYRNASDAGGSSLDSLQQLIRSRGEQGKVPGALPRIRTNRS